MWRYLCSNLGNHVVLQGGLEDGGVEELLLGIAQALLQLHKGIVGGCKDSRHQVGVVQSVCKNHTGSLLIASFAAIRT